MALFTEKQKYDVMSVPQMKLTVSYGQETMTKKLLICGSRHVSKYLTQKATEITLQAIAKNIHIICGDAHGIDKTIIDVCNAQKYANITVYGAKEHRNKTEFGVNEIVYGSYTKRDTVMVNKAYRVVCIWNGQSRGTKRNYDHAILNGKKAILIQEPEGYKTLVKRTNAKLNKLKQDLSSGIVKVEDLPQDKVEKFAELIKQKGTKPKCIVANRNQFPKQLPPNAVYMGRPSRNTNEHYGNPFSHIDGTKAIVKVDTREDAVHCFENWLAVPIDDWLPVLVDDHLQKEGWLSKLRAEENRRQWIMNQIPILANRIKKSGKDLLLVCWCTPKACHVDVIARMVNDLLK